MIIRNFHYYPTPFLVPLITFCPLFLQIILGKWVFPRKKFEWIFLQFVIEYVYNFSQYTILCCVLFIVECIWIFKSCMFMFCFEKCQSQFQIILQNNMLTILCWCFCTLSYNVILYAIYITHHLHALKNSWNFEILKHILNFEISTS
jgi:hypothetical protein